MRYVAMGIFIAKRWPESIRGGLGGKSPFPEARILYILISYIDSPQAYPQGHNDLSSRNACC